MNKEYKERLENLKARDDKFYFNLFEDNAYEQRWYDNGQIDILEKIIPRMGGYAKINKAKKDVVKELGDRISDMFEVAKNEGTNIDDLYEEILNYINKEYLFKSDYTK